MPLDWFGLTSFTGASKGGKFHWVWCKAVFH